MSNRLSEMMESAVEKTNDIRGRIETAQWLLERHLGWIAAAEVKVGVIVAIDTALLGGLAAAFSASDITSRTAWAYLFTLLSSGAAVLGYFCAAMAVLPRVNGPQKSLIFFGPIASSNAATYAEQFCCATDEKLLADLIEQIHRNAEIARDKFIWVRRSMAWSFFSVMPWIAALGLLIKFR